jgi:hypothetical protein
MYHFFYGRGKGAKWLLFLRLNYFFILPHAVIIFIGGQFSFIKLVAEVQEHVHDDPRREASSAFGSVV